MTRVHSFTGSRVFMVSARTFGSKTIVLKWLLITLTMLAVLQIGRGIWKDVVRSQRRQRAIGIAARKLSRAEQVDWFNRTGRYKDVGAIPRTLSPDQMTPDEYRRYENKIGEFAD